MAAQVETAWGRLGGSGSNASGRKATIAGRRLQDVARDAIAIARDGLRARGYDERFERAWRYYLAYCAAGFDTGTTDVHPEEGVRDWGFVVGDREGDAPVGVLRVRLADLPHRHAQGGVLHAADVVSAFAPYIQRSEWEQRECRG